MPKVFPSKPGAGLKLRLKLAQAKLKNVKVGERETAEAELQRLELENPEMALYTVIAGRAAEADEGSYEQWKWSRLAEEIESVEEAAAVLGLDEEQGDEDEWRQRSRALSELQHWTLRGNRKAESALLGTLRLHAGTWMAGSADELLRQAWGMHADANVNSLMLRAKESLKKKDAFTAIKAFEAAAKRALEVDEGRVFAEAHRWIALTHHRALNQNNEARRSFQTALDASPCNYVVLLDFARLLYLAPEASAHPKPVNNTETITHWLAGVHERDEAQAARYLERALNINPAVLPEVLKMKYNMTMA